MVKKLSALKRLWLLTGLEPQDRSKAFNRNVYFRIKWFGCVPLVPLSILEESGGAVVDAFDELKNALPHCELKRFVVWIKTDNNGGGEYLFCNPHDSEQVEKLLKKITAQKSHNLAKYGLSTRKSAQRFFILPTFAVDLIGRQVNIQAKAAA